MIVLIDQIANSTSTPTKPLAWAMPTSYPPFISSTIDLSKFAKGWNVMSRVYAEGLQRHPREEGLWIQVSLRVGCVGCLLVLYFN